MFGTCIDLSTLHPQSLPHLQLVPHSPCFFHEGLRNSPQFPLFFRLLPSLYPSHSSLLKLWREDSLEGKHMEASLKEVLLTTELSNIDWGLEQGLQHERFRKIESSRTLTDKFPSQPCLSSSWQPYWKCLATQGRDGAAWRVCELGLWVRHMSWLWTSQSLGLSVCCPFSVQMAGKACLVRLLWERNLVCIAVKWATLPCHDDVMSAL